ncbi:MAG: hypothetical protein ACR2IH_07470 [Pyrinomonadaceae bacterium]
MRANSGADEYRCAACGGENARSTAKFCNVCGKLLAEEYLPLDSHRSAHGLQGKVLTIERSMENSGTLFERGGGIAQTAWACVVYSMVPYLGILFLPFAFSVAAVGYFAHPELAKQDDRRLSAIYIGLSVIISLGQAILWSLFYLIPDLARSSGLPN